MYKKILGKINTAEFGVESGRLGLHLTFKSSLTGLDLSYWVHDPVTNPYTKAYNVTKEDNNTNMFNLLTDVSAYLYAAKVRYISQLKDKPVELEVDGNCLVTWRILTEVL